ncbi:hypothetical protein [Kitasatospora sp. CB02891]|uniref:hypothetical protein n=1 Tax=Kitasatospora sp. CB02891 TaxID=2020329 RepID=UPI0012FDB2F0|nr:hypothetical protein [Kitasatospora sp. CB02891]
MTARRRLGPGYLAAVQEPAAPESDGHARLLPVERVASAEPESEAAAAVPAGSTARRRLGPGYLVIVQDPDVPV